MAQQNTTPGGALNVVGKRAPNIDAVERVTGRAKYTGDIDIPGMSMSPVYFARPVTRSSASMFGPRLPTTFSAPPGVVFCCAMVFLYVRIRRDAAMTDSRIFL